MDETNLDHRTLAYIACALARTTLCGDDERPRLAIETAVRWLGGAATTRELQAAKFAAYDYARAGGSPAAAYAAATTAACTDPMGLGHYAYAHFAATARTVGLDL